MPPSDPSDVLPEAAAAERRRQHLEEIARERDRAHRELLEREAELARIQRIARVGGLEIDFRDGVRNRCHTEYLTLTHEGVVNFETGSRSIVWPSRDADPVWRTFFR